MRQNLKFEAFDAEMALRWIESGKAREARIDPSNFSIFRHTLEFAESQGVDVVLVDMPSVDILNRYQTVGAEAVKRIFRRYGGGDPHVRHIDYRRAFETRYDLFQDPIHLNGRGQKELTEKLAGEPTFGPACLRRLLSGSVGTREDARVTTGKAMKPSSVPKCPQLEEEEGAVSWGRKRRKRQQRP